jgi:hypothetical protein
VATSAAAAVGSEAIFDCDWRSGTAQQEAYRAMGCRGKPHACAEAVLPVENLWTAAGCCEGIGGSAEGRVEIFVRWITYGSCQRSAE